MNSGSLTSALRAHNVAALAQARPGQPVTLVVPVVVYPGNSPRPAPVASPVTLVQEPLVPSDGKSAATAELATSDTLLQRLLGLAGNGQWLQCVPALAGCAAAESAAQKTVGDQIIFVAPRIQPQISPPLGWALFAASINALNTALHVRVINAATGELIRELTLDPARNYQPTGNQKEAADHAPSPQGIQCGFAAIPMS